jgi:hypothetical protein
MIARNQTFSDVTVYLDGSSFYDCTFERCTVVFSGVLPAVLNNPRFVDCRWAAAGPAETTIGFLTALYKAGAKDLIEATFDTIRGKSRGTPLSGPAAGQA